MTNLYDGGWGVPTITSWAWIWGKGPLTEAAPCSVIG